MTKHYELGAKAENRKSKAFASKEGTISGLLERKLTKKWTAGGGVRFSQSKIKETGKGKSQNFLTIIYSLYTLYMIQEITYWTLKKGFEFKIGGAPYFNVRSKEKPFFKTRYFRINLFFFANKASNLY